MCAVSAAIWPRRSTPAARSPRSRISAAGCRRCRSLISRRSPPPEHSGASASTVARRCGQPERCRRPRPTVFRASSPASRRPRCRACHPRSCHTPTCGPPASPPTAIPPRSSEAISPSGVWSPPPTWPMWRQGSGCSSVGSSPIVSARPPPRARPSSTSRTRPAWSTWLSPRAVGSVTDRSPRGHRHC